MKTARHKRENFKRSCTSWGFPGGSPRFYLCVGMVPWRRKWQLTPVFLPGKSHRERSLAGYSPWAHKEFDMIEQLSMHAHSTNWGPRTEGHTSLERRITANIDRKKQKEHHYEILEHKSIENLIFFCVFHLKNNKNHTYFELLNIDCQSRTPCPIKLSLIWGRLYILSAMEELRKVNSQPSLFLTSHF